MRWFHEKNGSFVLMLMYTVYINCVYTQNFYTNLIKDIRKSLDKSIFQMYPFMYNKFDWNSIFHTKKTWILMQDDFDKRQLLLQKIST